MKETKNCIICGEKATTWCGYVLDGTNRITAGWCKKHPPLDFTGYLGKWKKKMKQRKQEKY